MPIKLVLTPDFGYRLQKCVPLKKRKSFLEVTLNALIHCERRLFLENSFSNKGNGYRDLSVFGYGRSLELKVPCDRLGPFKPLILMLYRNDDERRREAIYELYSKDLITCDISDVMDKLFLIDCYFY